MSQRVVGREPESAAIGEFVEAVPGGVTALLLEGEAGIGKTTLWELAVRECERRGYRLLSSRPAQAEAKLSFAGLTDLFDPILDEALPRLPPPQREALEVALLRREPGGAPPDQRTVSTAALGALKALAESGPVVLALDDLQWLDRPSVAVISFVARRLTDHPVAFVCAARSGAAQGAAFGLARSIAPERIRRLRVGPLEVGAVGRLLRDRLGREFPPPILKRLHGVSGGNPFFALEVGRVLEEEGMPTPGEPLPVPQDLKDLVARRVAGLTEGAREAVLLAAALAHPTVALVETALGRKPSKELLEADDAAVIRRDGDVIRFTHPLLASVVYTQAPAANRRKLHRRLAGVVPDVEERARHLALAADGPDPAVASALDEAAHRARSRGAPDAAAMLSELAAQLTPQDRDDDLRRRLAHAADCHFESGDTDRARGLLEQALEVAPPGSARAEALARLARVRYHADSFTTAAQLLEEALREATDDVRLRAEIERDAAWGLASSGALRNAWPHAQVAVELAERLNDPTLLASALTVFGTVKWAMGHGLDAAVMERALCLKEWADRLPVALRPEFVFGFVLKFSDDFDGARSKFESIYSRAAERGEEGSLPFILTHWSELECWAGNWEHAERYADEAHVTAVRSGQRSLQALALYARALVAAHRGEVESARASATESLELVAMSESVLRVWALSVLGFVELSVDDPAATHRHLGPVGGILSAIGSFEPGLFRFIPVEIEALISLGDLEQAKSFLAQFEGQGRAVGRAWAIATAARCRGLLQARLGDLSAADATLANALPEHDRLPMPFELGRTLLVQGTVRRKAGRRREARESLERALAILEGLGAKLWAEKARAELRRIGGRPAPRGELTDTERRVAELAASGHTNKEIAAALFVTIRAVEFTLTNVYRKLGVRSRTELGALLRAGDTTMSLS